MRFNFKKSLSLLLILILVLSVTGCTGSKKTYSRYVQGLLDLNYKGSYIDYLKTTDSSESDADAIYEASMDSLADTFISYYGVKIVDDGDTKAAFVDIVKKIYKKSNYEIAPAKKIGDVYFVDVTIKPMDILDITREETTAYIEDFNARIAAGEFDNYEIDQYELEFSQGIIDILEKAIPNISYKDPVTVSVTISTGDYYSISDTDFINISQQLITDETATESNTESTATSTELPLVD